MPDQEYKIQGASSGVNPPDGALRHRLAELDATAQLGALAHRVSHDLRSPLASLSAFFEMELSSAGPEEKPALLEMAAQVERMAEILHGITRYGKAGAPSCAAVPLGELLDETARAAALLPQAEGVSFFLSVPAGLNAAASGTDLQQALFNVLKNAVEAVSGKQGEKRVELSVSAEGGAVLASVSDNGPGIPEAALEIIFSKSVTTKQDHSGVGLLIARDLLLRNRGDLKLLNRAGGGLTAVLSLPRA